MDIAQYMKTVGQQARAASRDIARADSNRKNTALCAIAAAIRREAAALLAANRADVDAARAAGLEPAMLQVGGGHGHSFASSAASSPGARG